MLDCLVSNSIRTCTTLVLPSQKALVDRVPYHIPILLIFQSNYKKASTLTQQRKAARNPKSTFGCLPDEEREEEWKKCLEECRNCEAIWIGSASRSPCL